MTNSWDDYVGSSEPGTDEAGLDASSTADAGAAADLSDAGSDLGDAADAASWASWDQSTADEQSASALSYLDDAQTNLAEGWDQSASQDLANASAQEGLAADSTASAADYSSTAESDVSDASSDLGDASADLSSTDTSE